MGQTNGCGFVVDKFEIKNDVFKYKHWWMKNSVNTFLAGIVVFETSILMNLISFSKLLYSIKNAKYSNNVKNLVDKIIIYFWGLQKLAVFGFIR